ncbi:flagellar protein export ATPase FliI [Heliobacterium gestii]|uniref:Type 3 secretion system ATPase n=1 Tax=Heliomicrobium gestii TaxID=2699 RepID=A0A845LBB9_HELGE|nr:flagellar protein export ATPase FliI [Heliomicrobium gestii]MBM7867108.1 flagellum-specific ATP synthase [Heliomicrobium gestii]MZP43478.1 flagellar protein export ATPase FliI [Heliomicrobium gestii]
MQRYLQAVRTMDPVRLNGKVSQVIGLVIQSDGPSANLGEVCLVSTQSGKQRVRSEVVGFREGKTLLMPLGEMGGIGPGSQVLATGDVLQVAVGEALLGRILDGLGNPMDDRGPIATSGDYPLTAQPPNPLKRQRIHQTLPLGVKAIDGLLTCGRGQRLGIFAGSGVGKSTLLGMIARNTTADINVIGLIGERGREVREFIEKDLGPEGLARSVVVVATSDQPALVRLKGAFVATAIAEFFRDLGKDVILMMDSVTRFAMAQREVGLAVGEPPATRGYTPSVFAMLPKPLERSGTSDKGTITGLYTVLVDGDDMNEPIADAVRGILDGHIVLSRDLASQNHYPAIDILSSVSRVMIELVQKEHRDAAAQLRSVLATYREAKDLIDIGAYQKGANPQIDHSLKKIDACREFLRQDIFETIPFDRTIRILQDIFAA